MRKAITLILLFTVVNFLMSGTPPAPEEILGFRPGADFKLAKWERIEAYFKALEKASPKVKMVYLGKSTLGRPFFMVIISSEENLKNLEQIKRINKTLHSGRPMPESTLEELANKGKAIVAITCTIHSTEVGAALMSTELAYKLVTEEKYQNILDNVVLLLFPSLNPDGIDIVYDWYYQVLNTPYEASYPVKLYHYYAGHDNNRDWFMGNLKETQLVLPIYYKEYFPLLIYDVHQMGKYGVRFFFPPYKDPINPNIDPWLLREVNLMGTEVARELTRAGKKGVASSAIFDSWYMSANRACPLRHNVMSFLSEAASANYASPIFITPKDLKNLRGLKGNFVQSSLLQPWRGGWWHLRDIIEYELITATTMLKRIAEKKVYYLKNFYILSKRQIEKGTKEPPYAYIIPAFQKDTASLKQLIMVLLRQGVRVEKAEENFQLDGAHFRKGDYVVRLSQPYRAFIKDLLEIKRFPRIKEGKSKYTYPYDEAAWSLGFLMGVRVVEAREPLRLNKTSEITEKDLSGRIMGTGKHILLPASSPYSFMVINKAAKTSGTYIVRDKGEEFYAVRKTPQVSSLVRELGFSVKTANLRVDGLKMLLPRKVAIYQSYRPVMQEGWIRFVFDKFGVKYKTVHNDFIRSGALSKEVDVLIIPDLSGHLLIEGREDVPLKYQGGIKEDGALEIEKFVLNGGTLITIGRSALWAMRRFHLKVKDGRTFGKRKFSSPGSILVAEVNQISSISRGYGPRALVFYDEQPIFECKEGTPILTLPYYDATISGITFNEDIAEGKNILCEVKRGKGKIFLYGFKVVNRAQSVGSFNFLLNALYR